MIWLGLAAALLFVFLAPFVGLTIGAIGLRAEPKPLSYQERQIKIICDQYVNSDSGDVETLERHLGRVFGLVPPPPSNMTQMQRAIYGFEKKIAMEKMTMGLESDQTHVRQ